MKRLYRPVLTLHPERLDIGSAWIGHLPFAFWVIDAVKPEHLVELGTHGGVSYCAFCQAIDYLSLNTTAHAIDTWQGDSHTGDYPSDTYVELKAWHDERFAAFSELVRTTFDNAVDKFADGSIDLLHIDGLHTLDAVRHDYETWLPKVSDRGVILFHDVNVYERDFGVQELWRELSDQYPSFTFHHGHGLGVLATGEQQSAQIAWLTSLTDKNARLVRERFSTMAAPLQQQAELQSRTANLQSEVQSIDAARHAATQELAQSSTEWHQSRIELQTTTDTLTERLRQTESTVHELNLKMQELEFNARTRDTELQIIGAELETTGVELETTRAELQTTRAELESTGAELETTRAELQGTKNELNAANSRGDQLAHDITEITRSSSWRLTAPLRWVGGQRHQLTNSTSPAGSIYRTLRAPGGIGKAVQAVKKRGLHGSLQRLRNQVAAAKSLQQQLDSGDDYPQWIKHNDTLSAEDLGAIKEHTNSFDYEPLISVVMPVYNTEPDFLSACIDSVLNQTYDNWQLCIADDASSNAKTRQLLNHYQAKDQRIICIFRETQGGIASCTNTALESSTGEFIALLDHDDLLTPHALYMVAHELNLNPDLDILYSDEDKIDEHGVRHDPHFKSDFNLELLLGQNCFSHLGVYRATLMQELGGIRKGFDGSQDHDLALRMVTKTIPERIRHIPHILYHWRVFQDSGSFSTDNLDKAISAAVKAVEQHLASTPGASVSPSGFGGFLQVDWPLPAKLPSVSIIVPTRDNAELLNNCVQGLLTNTNYDNAEIVVVDNGSKDPTTLQLLTSLDSEPKVRVLRYDHEFNYSAINNFAVNNVSSDFVCLLNDDIEVIDSDWLAQMVALAMRDKVGAVGARLLYADNTVQHGGIMLGVMGVANHLHKDLPVESPGYFGRLQLTQELSAVTAACLVVKRSAYEEVGGLNEQQLAVAFNDVDFCLRLREAGYRNLWTPRATLYHLESASRGSDLTPAKAPRFEKEVNYMQERWASELLNDPFYNKNLTLDGVNMDFAYPSRAEKPWRL